MTFAIFCFILCFFPLFTKIQYFSLFHLFVHNSTFLFEFPGNLTPMKLRLLLPDQIVFYFSLGVLNIAHSHKMDQQQEKLKEEVYSIHHYALRNAAKDQYIKLAKVGSGAYGYVSHNFPVLFYSYHSHHL